MTTIQKILTMVLPSATVERMKEETNQWRVRCTACGHSKSLWETGGVRYRKRSPLGGVSATIVRCSQCGGLRAGVIEKQVPSGTAWRAAEPTSPLGADGE